MNRIERKQFIKKKRKKGITFENIGNILGISRQRVNQIYRNKLSGREIINNRIREKDNYQCQFCFTNNNLHVHHLDKNRKNNKETNLMTLCYECHRKLHAGLL